MTVLIKDGHDYQAYNILWEHFVLRVYCTYLLTYLLAGYPKAIPWNKFEDCGIIRCWVMLLKQTETQTRMNALLPRLSLAWVTSASAAYRAFVRHFIACTLIWLPFLLVTTFGRHLKTYPFHGFCLCGAFSVSYLILSDWLVVLVEKESTHFTAESRWNQICNSMGIFSEF